MIALIGGSGFIGSRLANRLDNRGLQFVIPDIQESLVYKNRWINCDVRNYNDLVKSLKGSNVIINLAAEHKDNVTPRSLYDDVNVRGAENVCEAADALGIKKIIFTSSVAVYGLPEEETDESGAFNYFNDYGRTKYQAEQVYKKWFDQGEGRSLLIIRPTVVFGEGNRGNVYKLLAQISSGQFLMIGNGANRKSMIYIENITALLERLLQEKGYFIANAVDKPDFTMNELVQKVSDVLGKQIPLKLKIPYWMGYLGGLFFDLLSLITGKKFSVSSVRIKKFCANTQFKSSTIHKLDFIPPVTLEDGLERTLKAEFSS